MIEELHQTGEGICANCGGRIVELTGWRSKWTHDAGDDGVYHRECPGTLYATPHCASTSLGHHCEKATGHAGQHVRHVESGLECWTDR